MSYPPDEYPGVRPYECDGTHWMCNLVYSGPNDTLQIEVCSDPTCAHIKAACTHERCAWNNEGTILSCAFCGRDAT